MDITRPGEDQGFATAGYDIVVAANVLHATPDLGETLQHIWRLLAAGGILVLNEVTAVQDFATLTFGLSEGWWAFRDGQRRLPGAPLVAVPGWRALLDETGFPEVLALGLNEQMAETEQQQSVLVARRNQEPASARSLGTRSGLSGSDQPAFVAHNHAESDTSLQTIIREELGQTLGLDASLIDPGGRFMDYGVDSILGLDLVNRLNRRFELELTPTLVI